MSGGRWIVRYQIAGVPGQLAQRGLRFRSLSKARSYARRWAHWLARVERYRRREWVASPTGWALAGVWRSPFIYGLKIPGGPPEFAVAT
jgi:hypothetical protein